MSGKIAIPVHLGPYELMSFLVFAAMIIGAMFLQTTFIYLYFALLILDFFGTLFDFVSIDRSFFALVFLLVGGLAEGYTPIESVFSAVGIIVLLDFSFLLRKIHDTNVLTTSILVSRLKTYVPTAGSAILVSYLFIFIYSSISFTLPYALVIFGVATVLAFMLFVMVIRTFKDSVSNPIS